MNKPTYQITDISNSFKQSSYPTNKIPKELTIYLDTILTKTPTPPKKEHVSEPVNDYFPFLIFDEKYKKVSFSNNRGAWKKNDENEPNDFFDNFKGKFNQNDVQTFKRNAEMTCSNSVNLNITCNRLLDFIENPSLKAYAKPGSKISVEELFESMEDLPLKKGTLMKIPLVECIYKINESINYSRKKPLWYVYHSEADSSYGPLSSEDLEQMISSKLLEAESKIRLIDTFVYKGCKPFEFFNLKDVQYDNFVDNICVSSLVYNFKVSNRNQYRKIDLNEYRDDNYSKGFQVKAITQPQTTIYSSNSTSLYETVKKPDTISDKSSNQIEKHHSHSSSQQGGMQGGNKGNDGNYASSYAYNNPQMINNKINNNFEDDSHSSKLGYKNQQYNNNNYYSNTNNTNSVPNNNNYYYGNEDYNNNVNNQNNQMNQNNNNKFNKQGKNRNNYNNNNNNRNNNNYGGKSLY